ncbi:hypothetical protein [Agromyces archimandritae]|uniref:Uncharacterized protein n=1 Tax=Agromyces archimandritae TaxID=2781962 RepID=A0A975FPU6_9MICO|nr:hypothetical protein [Agromyces archimandritae]QTX05804.1 hypothetical protein G127AT_06270 [Agromyces archimandritae]
MTTAAAIILLAILALFTVLQIALIAGAPLGSLAWGGADRVLPARKRVGSVVAIVLYVLFAWFFAMRAGLLPLVLPEIVVVVGCWIVTVYLALGTVMNALSKSKPERYASGAASLVLFVCALIVSLG